MTVVLRYLGYIIGFIFGLYTFEILQDVSPKPAFISEKVAEKVKHDKDSYEFWLQKNGYNLFKANQDVLSFGPRSTELRNTLEYHLLFDLIHVTCVVFIVKAERAYMAANTWGRHCNTLLFYSNNDVQLNYIDTYVIPMKNSWQFLCECIRHIWLTKKHLQWVILSFDDVYIIPENLRYFLATKDYNMPHYYGHNVYFWNLLYNSGQTSIVLSKGSIRAIVKKFNNVSSCEKSGRYMNNGDYYLGKYLTELNITAGDARDYEGRERFHILKLEFLLTSGSESIIEKYSKKSVWPTKVGKECCSDTTISFPTSGDNLLVHYLIYQAKVFHSGSLGNRPKNETDDPEAWKETAREEFGTEINVSEITASKYFQLWEKKVKETEKKNNFI